jgi:hypothetical protein
VYQKVVLEFVAATIARSIDTDDYILEDEPPPVLEVLKASAAAGATNADDGVTGRCDCNDCEFPFDDRSELRHNDAFHCTRIRIAMLSQSSDVSLK